ncbi:hypothetical protein CIW52_05345 [Mycolicibacterium sp. P9-64]|nr:hypothetical protein CIW52_05345 [Mycolicibacterium sp. P9-64]
MTNANSVVGSGEYRRDVGASRRVQPTVVTAPSARINTALRIAPDRGFTSLYPSSSSNMLG